mmetsp:Transcript_6156/g.23272  ORF Transcript_6156/g.23272 Transcript_6156/m.23272 type:complete len:274 (-) Transcript_6156:13-834(-)
MMPGFACGCTTTTRSRPTSTTRYSNCQTPLPSLNASQCTVPLPCGPRTAPCTRTCVTPAASVDVECANRDRADWLRPSFPYAVIGVPTLTNTLGSTSAFPTASANTVCSELSSTSSFSEYHTAPSATAKPAAMITVYPPASALETGFSGIHLSVISSYRSPRDARCTSEVPPESAALDFFAALEVLPVWRPRGGEKPAAAANPRGTGLGNRIGPTPGVPRLKGTARHAWRAAAGENDALVDTARVATRATRWCPPSKRARRDDAVDIACAGGA